MKHGRSSCCKLASVQRLTDIFLVKRGNVVTVLGGCPDGWEYYVSTDSCFYFSSEELSQTDARIECQGLGGDLPSIANQAEMNFISSNA